MCIPQEDGGMLVYSSTQHPAEGQKLVEAVRHNKVVLQTGSQQRSSVYFRQVCTIIRNNWLGALK